MCVCVCVRARVTVNACVYVREGCIYVWCGGGGGGEERYSDLWLCAAACLRV